MTMRENSHLGGSRGCPACRLLWCLLGRRRLGPWAGPCDYLQMPSVRLPLSNIHFRHTFLMDPRFEDEVTFFVAAVDVFLLARVFTGALALAAGLAGLATALGLDTADFVGATGPVAAFAFLTVDAGFTLAGPLDGTLVGLFCHQC